MTTIGVWIPFRAAGALGRPEDLPMGRAALELAAEGVDVVFGSPQTDGRFVGARARTGSWEPVADVAVRAVYDRFRSVTRPDEFRAGLARLPDVPFGNSPWFTDLCRDKLQSQRVIESAGIAMPEVVGGDEAARLAGSAVFVKPRFGSFGDGVRRVVPGELPGPVDARCVVQRAVPPPAGWAGISLRVLVQRTASRAWVARSPVARRHRTDPVVNAARGAEVIAAADMPGVDVDAVREVAEGCAASLDAAWAEHDSVEPGAGPVPHLARGLALEVGVDFVLDEALRAWPIEVNGRPRGRLGAVASRWPERFGAEHIDACATPLRTLASRV